MVTHGNSIIPINVTDIIHSLDNSKTADSLIIVQQEEGAGNSVFANYTAIKGSFGRGSTRENGEETA